MTEKTIFHYAPSEMTGSGFWAWVLSSHLRSGKNEEDVRQLASHFYKTHLAEISPETVREVGAEHKIGTAGRIDIILYGDKRDSEPPECRDVIAIIENKVFSTPSAQKLEDQVIRYAEARRGSAPIKCVMTWRYDTAQEWKTLKNHEIKMIDLEGQIQLFDQIKIKNSILSGFYEYASQIQAQIKDSISYATQRWAHIQKNPPPIAHNGFLKYVLLNSVTDGLKNQEYNTGYNPNGEQWVQRGFTVNDKRFFYRLDSNKRGLYLRLNYYTWIDAKNTQHKNKKTIMQDLARICLEINSQTKRQNKKNYPWALTGEADKEKGSNAIHFNGAYENAKESTLWYLQFEDCGDMTCEDIRKYLTDWHNHFVAHVARGNDAIYA